jgi:hypothetical protein
MVRLLSTIVGARRSYRGDIKNESAAGSGYAQWSPSLCTGQRLAIADESLRPIWPSQGWLRAWGFSRAIAVGSGGVINILSTLVSVLLFRFRSRALPGVRPGSRPNLAAAQNQDAGSRNAGVIRQQTSGASTRGGGFQSSARCDGRLANARSNWRQLSG